MRDTLAMISSETIRMLDRSSVAAARRAAVRHAGAAAFADTDRSDIAIITTELGTNLIRHARDGVLSVTSRHTASLEEIVLVAVDQGPGIADLPRSFRDGYSSAGSAGTGLGAVTRLASAMDVYSTPQGTVLVAEIVRPIGAKRPGPRIGAFTVAKEGQQENGDAWECKDVEGGLAVLVCDGLGHGEYASKASNAAADAFRSAPWRGAKEMLTSIDVALRSTRGAAAAVAFVEWATGRVRYCGVGNIAGCIVSGDSSRHLVSQNGIVGTAAGRPTEFDYLLGPGDMLIMHSDGITARWRPSDIALVAGRHPALVAAVLYRDFSRGNDDVAAVVIQA